jgi:hypothetical protein
MTSTQKKMLRYVTIWLKWKTGFNGLYHSAQNIMCAIREIAREILSLRFSDFQNLQISDKRETQGSVE